MIITGCNTSGCIRASTIDSFQCGYRTIIAEECVGDPEEQPHVDNLRDVGRRKAELCPLSEIIGYIEQLGSRKRFKGRKGRIRIDSANSGLIAYTAYC